MIIKTLLPIVLFFIFIGIAYTNFMDASKNNIAEKISNKDELDARVEKSEIKSLSLADQTIIKKYNEKINNLDLRDTEVFEKVLKDSLVEVNKIKNNYEREKLQLNIYSALGMHKEAYELNGKMLKDSFSFSRLYTQCILAFSAQRPKSEYEKCYADLAVEMQKELKLPHNNEAEYIAGKWGYLLFMYQAGHKEYEPKLKEMLNTIDDEQLKRQLETGYEVAVEQVKSYEKHSHD